MNCEKLKSLRISRNYTQAEMAKRLGMSQQNYSYIENGNGKPSYEIIKRIALALDCKVSDLLESED